MRIQQDRGFTLLEVMISMIILAIGILGLALLISVSIYGNSFSNESTRANALAQQEVESLVNLSSYGALPFVSITDSVSGVYKVYRTVEDKTSNASLPSGVVKIEVVVSWTDQKAVARTVNYSTLKPIV